MGTLAKYKEAEQPASIRLILDKLFEYERDDDARKAWAMWEAANVTYIDSFLMSRVSNQSKETFQITPSLGEEFKVYFGNSSPDIMQISGHTLNFANQQWLYDFKIFYETYLKGSKLTKNRIRAFLTFTDAIYEVLLTSFSYSESATSPGGVILTIDLIVLQWIPFGKYVSPLIRHSNNTSPATSKFSAAQVDLSDKSKEVMSMINNPNSATYSSTFGGSERVDYKKLMDQHHLYHAIDKTPLPILYNYSGKLVTADVKDTKAPPASDSLAGQIIDGHKVQVATRPSDAVSDFETASFTAHTFSEYNSLPESDKYMFEAIQNTYTAQFEGGKNI